jgi:hypothetical protein
MYLQSCLHEEPIQLNNFNFLKLFKFNFLTKCPQCEKQFEGSNKWCQDQQINNLTKPFKLKSLFLDKPITMF